MPKYHLDDIFDPTQAHPDDAHSVLMRLIPAHSRVLELGCASGYLSGYMERGLGCRVTGLEYDAESVAIAKTRCHAVFQADLDDENALDAVRDDGPYDVLLAAAVLEHLKYPERLLRAARPLLAPDARLIVSLPNVAHWGVRLRLVLGRFDYEDYGIMDRTHLRMYTLKAGRALLEDQGFVVDEFYIAGSGLQNGLNTLARRSGRPLPGVLLPGLLGYELIYVARLA
jgi:methionine biosynthesis protein MetW